MLNKQQREPKSIRDSARGQGCTVRLWGVCNHDQTTTVFAHVTGVRFGHGMGKKTNLGAYCCSACHDIFDGRKKIPDWLDKESVNLAFYEGVIETTQILITKGLLKYGNV
jgi:hypothetical protein